LPDFVDTAVKEIDDQLRALKREAARLEAARAALTGGRGRRRRPASDGAARPRAPRSAARRNGRSPAPRVRRGANTRASQALELVRNRPGITIREIAQAMKIQPNYLYRVLARLASDGEIKREGKGWHPASASSSTSAASPRRQRRAAKSQPVASATRTTGRRRNAAATQTSTGRTSRGATRASVLAALAGGEAMTAGQVASKAGLARPTVSTTLSKLAKSGEVQKAKRGYQLSPAR
jgi:DNA-binding MarR family transcriptional regulator